ncbi:MAG TPA: hypothetical protein VGE45_01875 [Chloroflexia bacterium]|jgi:hypothetical protein
MSDINKNRKRIVASGVAILALALGIFGSAVIPSLGTQGGATVAYADGCDGVRPPPDLDGLCPPTPTPTATPDGE